MVVGLAENPDSCGAASHGLALSFFFWFTVQKASAGSGWKRGRQRFASSCSQISWDNGMLSTCRFDDAERIKKSVFELMAWPSRKGWLHGVKFLLVQGGAEGTDERVLVLHTVVAVCEMRQVTSVEERHDGETMVGDTT